MQIKEFVQQVRISISAHKASTKKYLAFNC